GLSSSCDLLLPLQRETEVALGCLLRLLDECVKQDHPAFVDAKQHAADTALGDVAADFPQSVAEGTAQRHADRPVELDVLDVLPDDLPIRIVQAPEPFTNGLAAGGQLVEGSGQALHVSVGHRSTKNGTKPQALSRVVFIPRLWPLAGPNLH